jgi:Integrase zinc binding domain
MNDSAQRALPGDTPPSKDDNNIAVTAATSHSTTLRTKIESCMDLPKILHDAYHKDTIVSKMMAHPDAHRKFGIQDGLIWTKNQLRCDVVCIPRNVFHRGRRMIEIIIDHAHQTVGHYSQLKTSNYIQRAYWWPSMTADIESFCTSCKRCQMNKTSTQRPKGLLHSLPIPDRPWQSIGIDFMGPLPKSNVCDYLMVIIDRLTSQVHLVPTTTTVTAKGIACLFLKEIVRLHGVPDSIVSDRDSKFTSIFWRELQRLMGTKLVMATAFHPQTDGATERKNRSIDQVLKFVVCEDQKDWAAKCPMVNLVLNRNVSTRPGSPRSNCITATCRELTCWSTQTPHSRVSRSSHSRLDGA